MLRVALLSRHCRAGGAVPARAMACRLQSAAAAETERAPEAPFRKLMAANRGEIATRIMRAGTELGISTVGIFSMEDRFTQHRYKADQAFLVGAPKVPGGKPLTPVQSYLDVEGIVDIAVEHGVEAIHPGYGFLSERADFARLCRERGVRFVGPTPELLEMFGDKTSAREVAERAGVPVVPGTKDAVRSVEEAVEACKSMRFPVIIKAAMGGGGRGMRVVESEKELPEAFQRATSEAENAFGDGSVFIEQYLRNPRHIEVQILGDGTGDVVHLYDRDCSVQRRHQKVVEIAPAANLPEGVREKLLSDATRITGEVKYLNAGTVEFLVDQASGDHYFIEVNPRVQVEHTVTEEVTGIDVVQSQIQIASGKTLKELGLEQSKISTNGVAMQCRVTTEDPAQDFRPDTGTLEVFRSPGGMGIRLDDGPGFAGAQIQPYYDSLLVKVTAHANTRANATAKLRRALAEFRVRGVTTNKDFLLNVLQHPDFVNGVVHTGFIAENPDLVRPSRGSNRGQKILRFISDTIVNGPDSSLGAVGPAPSSVNPVVPQLGEPAPRSAGERSLKQIFDEDGPEAFAKAVRSTDKLLITDTTMRDAHQSLLATRLRTEDILSAAPSTAVALRDAFSLECWGGATFDVALRFLKECPWERLAKLREAVPDVPLQMLIRGANGVGYTAYPDNVVFRFCERAKETGMDVFRVFDSLNYLENMRLGIDAVGAAGGIIEAAICYTGDVADPARQPYTLDYYLEFARQLHELGVHVLAVKDMAGLLKPEAAKLLIGALRAEFPDTPIHVHTHDTAGTGVASMLACAHAGADAVDAAMDSMSGMTSQPSLGAIIEGVRNTPLDTGMDLAEVSAVNNYWEECRGVYAPFESGQKSGSADVYVHEMPGGQYTNLLFQSQQLGLSGQWAQVKQKYAEANHALGDIPKVTPSSKVVGDLAQFMVQNDLDRHTLLEKVDEGVSLPNSVVEYFQGYLGLPPFGFPETLRAKVLQDKTLPNGKSCFEGRPGAEMEDFDFEAARKELEEEFPEADLSENDVLSYAQYPKVFKEFLTSRREFGDLSVLDTRTFVSGLQIGQEVNVELESGKTLFITLKTVSDPDSHGIRSVGFELNGHARTIRMRDRQLSADEKERPKANKQELGSIGAPMPGMVVEVKAKVGDVVEKGALLLVLSAMKMETPVTAPIAGKVKAIAVVDSDNVGAGDLLVDIEQI